MSARALGEWCVHGHGVAQDKQQALKYYKLAVDQGHVKARYKLGKIYDKGKGVDEDKQQAMKYYKQFVVLHCLQLIKVMNNLKSS